MGIGDNAREILTTEIWHPRYLLLFVAAGSRSSQLLMIPTTFRPFALGILLLQP